jgi:HPt (histidine-containing phosphotransfer) domain-containing protein
MNHTGTSTTNPGAPPIDEQVLADLIASIGVEAIPAQIEIFDLFFDSAPQIMARVSQAADLGAWEQVRAELHALKGSCELFGATGLVQCCKDLARSIACGEVAGAPAQVAQIQAEFERVIACLRQRRPASAGGQDSRACYPLQLTVECA